MNTDQPRGRKSLEIESCNDFMKRGYAGQSGGRFTRSPEG